MPFPASRGGGSRPTNRRKRQSFDARGEPRVIPQPHLPRRPPYPIRKQLKNDGTDADAFALALLAHVGPQTGRNLIEQVTLTAVTVRLEICGISALRAHRLPRQR